MRLHCQAVQASCGGGGSNFESARVTVVTGCGAVLASRHGCTRKARFCMLRRHRVGLCRKAMACRRSCTPGCPVACPPGVAVFGRVLLAEFWESVNRTVLWGIPNFGGLPKLALHLFGDDRAVELPQRCHAGLLSHCKQCPVSHLYLINNTIISSPLLLNSSILKPIQCTASTGPMGGS